MGLSLRLLSSAPMVAWKCFVLLYWEIMTDQPTDQQTNYQQTVMRIHREASLSICHYWLEYIFFMCGGEFLLSSTQYHPVVNKCIYVCGLMCYMVGLVKRVECR